MTNLKSKNGYTLVEMIIYIAILSVVSFIIINTLLSFMSGYRSLGALNAVDRSGIDVMERITRDIRGATSVDSSNSTLGSNPGVLTLVTTSNNISTTTKFYLNNGIVKMDVNGSYFGPLTLSNASVTSLIFTKLNSGISTAVKVDVTISATVGTATKTKSYHSTIVLKSF